ncbi:MAG: succinylglutamate desuccinylase/aspartoacylase family protein [Pseudomonadales bacterium]|nr:succinylglutamate desuccinylase/aspartoacylase family protein [Pseudomonadales bacterium]MBO7006130.1 succinylglutamate desuccinylase/aspartoacylase family protein [Pseudomonadales bacterium]
MTQTQPSIRKIPSLDKGIIGSDPAEFLRNLQGPAWFEIAGQNSNRRRAIVTLIHGNEPSGLKAIHHLLSEEIRPATDLGVLVASVDAALHAPLLTHRYIPGERDLNRCFGLDDGSNQARLTSQIVKTLEEYQPEAVVDTHNTSSHSEPFCVAVRADKKNEQLARLFTDHLIIIPQKLGTLLEHVPADIPTITVEFGAFMDTDADSLARETIHRFVTLRELENAEAFPLNLLNAPLRLETERHLTVTYSSSVDENADLTMINSIDQFNFRRLEAGQVLGWFGKSQHEDLVARDGQGNNQYTQYFDQEEALLRTRQPITVFMATTDPVVANNDCLLYFNPA